MYGNCALVDNPDKLTSKNVWRCMTPGVNITPSYGTGTYPDITHVSATETRYAATSAAGGDVVHGNGGNVRGPSMHRDVSTAQRHLCEVEHYVDVTGLYALNECIRDTPCAHAFKQCCIDCYPQLLRYLIGGDSDIE